MLLSYRPQSLKCIFRILVLCQIIRRLREHINQVIHIIHSHALIHAQSDPTFLIIIEVDTHLLCYFTHNFHTILWTNFQRIKKLSILLLIAICL